MKNHTELQMQLDNWRGAFASIHEFTPSHLRLILRLVKPGNKEHTFLSFPMCDFICGRTNWGGCNLRIEEFNEEQTAFHVVVVDHDGEFKVVCRGGPFFSATD